MLNTKESALSNGMGVSVKGWGTVRTALPAQPVGFGLDISTFLTYSVSMQTVVETETFLHNAKAAGLTEQERTEIVDFIALNPTAGDEIKGTGGARKVRFAGKGKGKSGGYRVITFYSGEDIPVFLLNVYAKNQKIDLSQAERNELKAIVALIDDYRRRRSR